MCHSLIYERKAVQEPFYGVTVRIVFLLSKSTEMPSVGQMPHAKEACSYSGCLHFLIGNAVKCIPLLSRGFSEGRGDTVCLPTQPVSVSLGESTKEG